jgi:hypothetical protein
MIPKEDQEKIAELEMKIGLKKGFCCKLLEEDDWSFVIKLHAVFEAALSRLICKQIGKDGLLDIISRLDTSNTSCGKLAFAKALGYIEDEERKFIRNLSELRNSLVHNISNSSFQFSEYLSQLDDKRAKSFLAGFVVEEFFQPNLNSAEVFRQAKAAPKWFVWLGAQSILWNFSHYLDWAEYDKTNENLDWFMKHLEEQARIAQNN